MLDVMLDIETFGTRIGDMVIAIGAYAFDPFGESLPGEPPPDAHSYFDPQERCFHENVQWSTASEVGMRIHAPTLEWWLLEGPERPSHEAFRAVTEHQVSLKKALHRLLGFCSRHQMHNVWADDPTFDCALLNHAYDLCAVGRPWSFRQERSVRTVRWVAREANISLPEPVGIKHHPLHDAYNQAREVVHVLGHLGIK